MLFFFANLLPEGNLLDTLFRLRRLPRGNVFRLLETFGRECAGAFEIVPEGEQNARAPEPDYSAYTRAALRKDLASLRANIPLLQAHDTLRLSLAGAQNKIPVRYDGKKLWLPQHGAPSTHILKPALQPEAEYPDAVLNEALCLRLAAALGLNVPATTVLTDPEPMLLIALRSRRGWHEDPPLASVDMPAHRDVARPEIRKRRRPGFARLSQVDAHSASPALDRLALVDWLLCNFLVGNAMRRMCNALDDGRLHLAPAYDLLALGYWPRSPPTWRCRSATNAGGMGAGAALARFCKPSTNAIAPPRSNLRRRPDPCTKNAQEPTSKNWRHIGATPPAQDGSQRLPHWDGMNLHREIHFEEPICST